MNFTCKGIGNELWWYVQGNNYSDPSNQDREILVSTKKTSVDVWSSVLTIKALPKNDRISIGCTVISFNPSSPGPIEKGANLTIRG